MQTIPGQTAPPATAPIGDPAVRAGAHHYQLASVLATPTVVPYPDAAQIAYGDGSWAWVTDPELARAHAAAWTEAATHLDEIAARKAAAA